MTKELQGVVPNAPLLAENDQKCRIGLRVLKEKVITSFARTTVFFFVFFFVNSVMFNPI